MARICARLFLACATLICVLACGGSGGGDSTTDTGAIRVVNVIPDAPALSASLGGTTLGSVSYGQASALTAVAPGDYELTVSFARPDGTVTEVVDGLSITIRANEQTSVLLIGPIESVSTKVVSQPDPDLSASSAEVWFVNASTGLNSLDFFLDSTGAPLASLSRTASLAFGTNSDRTTVTAGSSYRLRTVETGTTTANYDSGVFAIRALTRRLFVACDYFGPGGSGTRVIQVDTASASTFPAEILPSAVRFAHLIASESAVDIYLDGVAIATGLAYGQFSHFVQQQAANAAVVYTAPGDSSATLYSNNVNLTSGQYRTHVVARASTGSVVSRTLIESMRPIADTASISVIQASPGSGDIDLYFLAPAQPLSDAIPEFHGLGFLVNGALELEAAQYDVVAAPEGEETVTTGPERIDVSARGLYTVVLTDALGGGVPGQILFHDDHTN